MHLPTDHVLAVCGGASSALLRAAEGDLHLFYLLLEDLLLLSQLLVAVHRERCGDAHWTGRSKRCARGRVGRLREGNCWVGGGEGGRTYTLAWLRSSSFSSASFWLLSSITSTTCFSLRTSSWSFWLLIWRSVTQYTNSDVSLEGVGGDGGGGGEKACGHVLTEQQ